MINRQNFKALLGFLGFTAKENIFIKNFENEIYLKVDFKGERLIYPNRLKVHEKQTCNFSSLENMVVFESVYQLLNKGYKPEHIELEPKWKVGHGASGGRADILVRDQTNEPLLIIECKTYGKEFEKAWRNMQKDGGQLFSYAHQISKVKFLCLYASEFKDGELTREQRIISHRDNDEILKANKSLKPYREASNVEERFKVWKDTYQLEYTQKGIFEENIQPYPIGKINYTLDIDTRPIQEEDKKGKYHRFRTILRQHNIARKETAFEVLVNLFLAKIVDEKYNKDNLKFYWKGRAYDNYFDFVDRLQNLYRTGMYEFLKEDVTYISNEEIDSAFWAIKGDGNVIKETIQDYFRQLKFFSNNAFSLINVHNKELFNRNTKVLIELVQMWQNLRLKSEEPNQFLGDMFEYFLDNSIKQSEGQFFTPLPITRFIVSSLPLETKVKTSSKPIKAIDYACGSGHFLIEYAHQVRDLVKRYKSVDVKRYYENTFGIEKEDRLAKIAKVSSFMYGQDGVKIFDKDALTNIDEVEDESFDILVANPPFAVEGFLLTLSEEDKKRYELIKTTELNSNTNNIQCFFIERAKQLIKPSGVVGIIVPSSILSNSDMTHIATREIILKYFDIISIVELGSGTFGKTGTNTVVLFLKRRDKKPELAKHYANRIEDYFEGEKEDSANQSVYQDINLIQEYCKYLKLPFEEYKKLFGATANNIEELEELFKSDIFMEYRKDFESSTDTKNLKKKKSFKEKTKEEQQKELDTLFIKYLHKIEKDKLYYFILAHTNNQKVLIVKSPKDNKLQKKFLGYEWSGAKGQEGIKYYGGTTVNDIITPLFNPKDRGDKSKISYLIQQNFLGNEIDLKGFEEYKELISYRKVTNILDFSRVEFNKSFSLTSKKEIKTKWKLVKLGDFVDVKIGGTPSRRVEKYFNGKNLWVSIAEMSSQIIFDTKEKITNEAIRNSNVKLIPKGTTLLSFKLSIGKTAIAGKNLYTNEAIAGLIPLDKNILLDKYLFYLFSSRKIDLENIGYKTFGKSLNSKFLKKELKIPLPPKDIQQKIVDECEQIDNEVQKAEEIIKKAKEKIESKVKEVLNNCGNEYKISDLTLTSSGGTPLSSKKEYYENGKIPWINSGEVEQGEIYESSNYITELGLKNSSAKFFPKDTILLAMYGATAGKVGILKIEATTNQAICAILPNEKFLSKFLFLQLKIMYQYLLSLRTGIARDNLSQTKIKNIKVKIPPLSKQKALVDEVEKLEIEIKNAKSIIDSVKERKEKVMEKYL